MTTPQHSPSTDATPGSSSPPTVSLVTGASSGIGWAIAERLARAGHGLVLVARREAQLQQLAQQLRSRYQVTVEVCTLDLTSAQAAPRLHDFVRQRGLDVGIVINNAGFGAIGAFQDSAWDIQERMIQLNILAATAVVKELLPDLLARGGGRILNVASTAAFLPGPLMAVYYASKAYLLSWSQALSHELAGQGVTVTALCPGPTRTGFEQVAGLSGSSLFSSPAVMSAEAVADIAYKAMMRGKRVAVAGWLNRLMAASTHVAPTSILMKVARSLHERVVAERTP